MKQRIIDYFKKDGLEATVKYIDPSYMIRCVRLPLPLSPSPSLYAYLPVRLPVCLSVYLPVNACLSIYLSICLWGSACLSVRLSISVFLCSFVCSYTSLSICSSPYLSWVSRTTQPPNLSYTGRLMRSIDMPPFCATPTWLYLILTRTTVARFRLPFPKYLSFTRFLSSSPDLHTFYISFSDLSSDVGSPKTTTLTSSLSCLILFPPSDLCLPTHPTLSTACS